MDFIFTHSCQIWPHPKAGKAEDAAGDAERHEQHDEQQQPAAQHAARSPEPVTAHGDHDQRRQLVVLLFLLLCFRLSIVLKPLLPSVPPGLGLCGVHGHKLQLCLLLRIRQRRGRGRRLGEQAAPRCLRLQPAGPDLALASRPGDGEQQSHGGATGELELLEQQRGCWRLSAQFLQSQPTGRQHCLQGGEGSLPAAAASTAAQQHP